MLYLAYYESLQDKLGQLKDAREALNALRDEHMENKKRQAMERERQRQIQLAVKLDDMRQKKQVRTANNTKPHTRTVSSLTLGLLGISTACTFATAG